MSKKVIVLEFNELVPHLIDRFIAEGKLPNFAKLRGESLVAITDAKEEFPNLEPWIQWVTVHTGLTYAEHKVFDLDDGPKLAVPRVWDMVSDAGKPVWVCGSMNAAVQKDRINGAVLPDPWATGVEAYPSGYFDPFLDLIRPYVQEYTSGKPPVRPPAIIRFGRFMMTNGLSIKTITDTVSQLIGELRSTSKWRRAVILDRLTFDVFRKVYNEQRPTFSTFFVNSVAHYQHYYWRNMDPGLFTVKSEAKEQETFADAILYGYQKIDEIVGEILEMADDETSIVFCTALSQQPMLSHEETGGKRMYKPRDQAKLFAFAGITAKYEYAPVMAEQFHLIFATDAEAAEAADKVRALRLASGEELMLVRLNGNRIFSGCNLEAPPPAGSRIVSSASNQAIDFDAMFYPLETVRSGMHHPDGMLWIRTSERRHAMIERKIELTEIAPTLLALAGVETSHRFSKPVIAELEQRELISA